MTGWSVKVIIQWWIEIGDLQSLMSFWCRSVWPLKSAWYNKLVTKLIISYHNIKYITGAQHSHFIMSITTNTSPLYRLSMDHVQRVSPPSYFMAWQVNRFYITCILISISLSENIWKPNIASLVTQIILYLPYFLDEIPIIASVGFCIVDCWYLS